MPSIETLLRNNLDRAARIRKHRPELFTRLREELDALPPDEHLKRMCELNVLAQVRNVTRAAIVRNTWKRDPPLFVHGWIFSPVTGGISAGSPLS